MSIESRSRRYGKVFDHWQIREFLGSGSGGKTAVFRLVRSDSDRGASALKVVNLIEERGSLEKLSARRREEYEAVRDECSSSAEQEVWMMDDLRGNTNIVDYLDHTFVDWEDDTGFGRDLLIRMELLKDLRSELRSGRQFTEAEVLKVGRDICIALILCHRKNILHRDVKPENIFLNKDGNYKLGDFGVSRVLDACPGAVASTGIGTYEYWPAEQMTGRYDTRVDTYSLGLVLYELSNKNRLPFAASSYTTSREVSQRLTGVPLPPPCDASPELTEVILKACAFEPEDRFPNAEAFLRALRDVPVQKASRKQLTVGEKSDADATVACRPQLNGENRREAAEVLGKEKTTEKTDPVWKKKPSLKLWVGVLLLIVCVVFMSRGLVSQVFEGKSEPTGESTGASESVIIPTEEKETLVKENASETTVPEETTSPETTVPETTMLSETEPLEIILKEQTAEETKKPVIGIVNSLESGVSIRSGADVGAEVLGEYKIGTYIRILETTDANGVGWLRTEDGWIRMDDVYLIQEREEGEQTPAIGRVNKRSTHVNIRQSATSDSGWLGDYPAGTILEILEISYVNGIQWGRTEKGWVCMTYVNIIPEQVEEDTPVIYTGWVALASELNVRKMPSVQAEVETRLRRGEWFNIYETCVAEGKRWGRCDAGWIDLQYSDLLPVDLEYSDVRIVKTNNAQVYSNRDQLVQVGSVEKLEMVLVYEYFGYSDNTMCRTDLGWIPEECFY